MPYILPRQDKIRQTNYGFLRSILVKLSFFLIFLTIFFVLPVNTYAATYYVDQTGGNDNNSGIATDQAWKTISKINAAILLPGDLVLLKRDEKWRESLKVPTSGTNGSLITFGAYGSGNKPILDGSDPITGLVSDSGAVYKKLGWDETDNILFVTFEDNARLIKATSRATMVAGSWFNDTTNHILYVWSTDSANPSTHLIEWAAGSDTRSYPFDLNGQSYITVSDIVSQKSFLSGFNIRYANVHDVTFSRDEARFNSRRGFDGGGTSTESKYNIVIDSSLAENSFGEGIWMNGHDCIVSNNEVFDVSRDGLQKGYGDENTIDGTGILIGVGSVDNTVLNNFVHDIYLKANIFLEYEPGLGNPPLRTQVIGNHIVGANQASIVVLLYDAGTQESLIANNLFEQLNPVNAKGMNIGTSGLPSSSTHIYNNTFIYEGGWPVISGNLATGLEFKNNIVYRSSGSNRVFTIETAAQTGFVSDYNIYTGLTYQWGGVDYNFTNWKATTGQDIHSQELSASAIKLVNPVVFNYYLQSLSPAIDTGVNTGVISDKDGNSRPQGSAYDIGAYEFSPVTVTINQKNGQIDPTNASPVNFTVVFSESVSDFVTGDVTLSGSAGATTATVTGSGTTYNVAVTGMTGSGNIGASILADRATGIAGNINAASTSTNNNVVYDITPPTLTSITISDSLGYTNSATPIITIVSSNSPTQVAFSCNGGTNWSSWITYVDTISSFNITSGASGCSVTNGSKTITAKLKDVMGNESTTTSTSTIYDTTAPSTPGIPSTPSPTNSSSQTWEWSAAIDTLSGVANYNWRVVDTLNNPIASGTTTDLSIVTNLADGDWNFFVKAIDNVTNQGSESTSSITVDKTSPTISFVSSGTPTSSGSTITWLTNEVASSKIEYGLTSAYGSTTDETDISPRVSAHLVTLPNLTSCTLYHYRVSSTDAAINESVGDDNTFITYGCPSTSSNNSSPQTSSPSAPSCSDTTPTSISDLFQIDTTGSTAKLYFTTLRNNVTGYAISYGLKPGEERYGTTISYNGFRWIIDTTIGYLSSNTTYYFKVKPLNGCNAGGWSKEIAAKTTGSKNITRSNYPKSIPTLKNLKANLVSKSVTNNSPVPLVTSPVSPTVNQPQPKPTNPPTKVELNSFAQPTPTPSKHCFLFFCW